MTKKFLTATFALALALTTTGCFEDMAVTFDEESPLRVEFAQVQGGYAAAYADGQTISLTVNLIAPQQSSDVSVNVAVIGDGTNAVEGAQYSFPNGTTVTIPAGTSFGELQIDLLEGPLDDNSRTFLQLELQDTGDVIAEDNLDDFTVQIADL